MLSKHIKRNTYYTFVFTLSEAESVYAASLHLQLDPRCQRMLGSLHPGTCVFRQTQASWNNAMLCQIDYVEPARNVGPIEYTAHPYTPAVSLAQSPHVLADLDATLKEHERTMERQSPGSESATKQLAIQLLRLAASNPYVPVARLFERLDRPKHKVQIAVRQYLQDEDYAKFEEPRIGRSNRLLIEITARGYEALGLPAPEQNKGRGGIAHRHFAHWIKLYFEKQGLQAYVEWVVPGTNHPTDIAVLSANGWIVFEICVTASDALVQHMEACFEQSKAVQSMTVVAGTQTELKGIQRAIRAETMMMRYGARIRFEVIESYVLKELTNESH